MEKPNFLIMLTKPNNVNFNNDIVVAINLKPFHFFFFENCRN